MVSNPKYGDPLRGCFYIASHLIMNPVNIRILNIYNFSNRCSLFCRAEHVVPNIPS